MRKLATLAALLLIGGIASANDLPPIIPADPPPLVKRVEVLEANAVNTNSRILALENDLYAAKAAIARLEGRNPYTSATAAGVRPTAFPLRPVVSRAVFTPSDFDDGSTFPLDGGDCVGGQCSAGAGASAAGGGIWYPGKRLFGRARGRCQ